MKHCTIGNKFVDIYHILYLYFFLDIFMFDHGNDLHSSVSEKPKNLSHVVTKWWKSLNRNLALRFFHLAQTGDRTERRRAVNSLSLLNHLKGNSSFSTALISLTDYNIYLQTGTIDKLLKC